MVKVQTRDPTNRRLRFLLLLGLGIKMVARKKEISGESYKFIAAYKMGKIFADHTPGLELISKICE